VKKAGRSTNTVGSADVRTRAIHRKLRRVETNSEQLDGMNTEFDDELDRELV